MTSFGLFEFESTRPGDLGPTNCLSMIMPLAHTDLAHRIPEQGFPEEDARHFMREARERWG